jgi:ferredoxin
MPVRNIVKIDEDKCNGCGECVTACAEGAIEIIDGKAKLVSEIYCDGLGECLGHCPEDAITIEQRESEDFDEKATEEHLAKMKQPEPAAKSSGSPCGCPGMMARDLKPVCAEGKTGSVVSQLQQWPVQLGLVSPAASYFKGADLLLVADCVPFAMGDFHERLLKGNRIAIGCPKLDDPSSYIDKVSEIVKVNGLSSLTVVHMEVPCCSGMTYIAREAIAKSGVDIVFEDITIGLGGDVVNTETISA